MLKARTLIVTLVSLTLLTSGSASVLALTGPVTVPTAGPSSEGFFHTVSLENAEFPAGDAPESFLFVIDTEVLPNSDGAGTGGALDVLYDKISFPASDDLGYTEVLSIQVGGQEYTASDSEDCSISPTELPSAIMNSTYTTCEEDDAIHIILVNLTRNPLDSVSIELGISDAPTQPDTYSLDLVLSVSARSLYDNAPVDVVGEAPVPLQGSHTVEFEVLPPPVDEVQVEGPSIIRVGQSTVFSASALVAGGEIVEDAEFSWSVEPFGCGHVGVGQDSSQAFFFAGSTAQECTMTATETLSGVTGSEVFQIVAGAAFTIEFDHSVGDDLKEISVDPLQHEVFVTVFDAFENPAAGEEIFWSVLLGEDEVELSETQSTTGSDGRASVVVTFPPEIESESIIGTEFRVRAVDDLEDAQRTRNSGTWVIVPGALDSEASTLDIPEDAIAGEPFTATLTLRDQYGNLLDHGMNEKNGDLEIALGGANAAPDETDPECAGVTLGEAATVTFTDAVATFECTLYAAETVDLQVTGVEGSEFTAFGPSINVAPAAADHLVWTTGAQTVIAGECNEYTLQVRDQYSNPQPADALPITLSDGANGAFYETQEEGVCEAATGEVTIADEESSATFYYRNTVNEDVTLEAESAGLLEDTLVLEVHPAAPSSLVIHAGTEQTAGESFTLDLEAIDEFGNRLDRGINLYDGDQTLTLSGPGIAPAGNEPVCEGGAIGEELTVTFTAGFASELNCVLYNREIVDLIADDANAVIEGTLEIEILAAAFDSWYVDPAESPFDHNFVGPGTEHGVSAIALDAFDNRVPDIQMYAWLVPFGNNLNGATLSDGSGLTDNDGAFTTTLTVSANGGDRFRVLFSPTDDPSDDTKWSRIYEVADHYAQEGDSIQALINVAEEGDVILVGEGIYEERLDIHTENLRLLAEGHVIVRANDATAGGNSGPTMWFHAAGVSIEGFHVERLFDDPNTANTGNSWGIRVQASDVSVLGGSISMVDDDGLDNSNAAIFIRSPTDGAISNVAVDDVELTANQVVFRIRSVGQIDGISIINNHILAANSDGIWIDVAGNGQAPTNMAISNNQFNYDAGTAPYVRDGFDSLDLEAVAQSNTFLTAIAILDDRIVKAE
jgi:hypothetical protein